MRSGSDSLATGGPRPLPDSQRSSRLPLRPCRDTRRSPCLFVPVLLSPGGGRPASMVGRPETAIVTRAEGAAPVILPGNEVNRLGLVCSGTTISASVNGVELAKVEDGSSATGSLSLRVNASGSGGEARFGD